MAKSLSAKGRKKQKPPVESLVPAEPILIDKKKNWVFDSEESVFRHFEHEITVLEHENQNLKRDTDIDDESIENFEEVLAEVFDSPDEVWRDTERFETIDVYTYIKKFPDFIYIALTYLDEGLPTFIFLHFATQDETVVDAYRRTEKLFDKSLPGAEGDALAEGDELATGLYKAMLTVRSEGDVSEEDFPEYLEYRDETVQDADEVWRSTDLQGNVLVTFIKDFQETEEKDFWYVTVTLEDSASETHYVLFSFPTADKTLADRYRHGELLHTEDVVQEDSH